MSARKARVRFTVSDALPATEEIRSSAAAASEEIPSTSPTASSRSSHMDSTLSATASMLFCSASVRALAVASEAPVRARRLPKAVKLSWIVVSVSGSSACAAVVSSERIERFRSAGLLQKKMVDILAGFFQEKM